MPTGSNICRKRCGALIGKSKIRLLRQHELYKDGRSAKNYLCSCESCGNKFIASKYAITSGKVVCKVCGEGKQYCRPKATAGSSDNMVGRKVAFVTVLKKLPTIKGKDAKFDCLCKCGEHIVLSFTQLMNVRFVCKHCTRNAQSYNDNAKLEEYRVSDDYSEMYKVAVSRYYGIHYRCYSSKSHDYPLYGGRGIGIADCWRGHNKKYFILWCIDNGINDDLEVDRIDSDGPYAPWNCRLVESRKNARNKRGTIKYYDPNIDEMSAMRDIAERYCVPYGKAETALFNGTFFTDESGSIDESLVQKTVVVAEYKGCVYAPLFRPGDLQPYLQRWLVTNEFARKVYDGEIKIEDLKITAVDSSELRKRTALKEMPCILTEAGAKEFAERHKSA